jgi:hypothetical protein
VSEHYTETACLRQQQFFDLAAAREFIREKKMQGSEWRTEDEIFSKYRFCNVHREDDKVTTWFRENIRSKLESDPWVIIATIAFRWFNRIETGEVMISHGKILEGRFDAVAFSAELRKRYPKGPWVTGSYMIKSPAKMDKIEGLICCILQAICLGRKWLEMLWEEVDTLEELTSHLKAIPFLGAFMAYEVASDLRWTDGFYDSTDVMTWANPGPGCMRGLSRILFDDKSVLSRNSKADVKIALFEMRILLEQARVRGLNWEMREVEHWLCEADKYWRVLYGEGRPKQLYAG